MDESFAAALIAVLALAAVHLFAGGVELLEGTPEPVLGVAAGGSAYAVLLLAI